MSKSNGEKSVELVQPRFLENCESLVHRPDCESVYFTQLLDLVQERGSGEFMPVVHPAELIRGIGKFGNSMPAAVAKLQALRGLLIADGSAPPTRHRVLARKIETAHRKSRKAARMKGKKEATERLPYAISDEALSSLVRGQRLADSSTTASHLPRNGMDTMQTVRDTVRDLLGQLEEIRHASIVDHRLRPTIAIGVRYRQEWCSQGYNRGDLIRSIPLTADSRKEIVVKTWRVKNERREENESVEANISNEYVGDEKWSLAVQKQTSVEMNQSLDARLNVRGDVTIPVKKVPVKVGGEAGGESSTDLNVKNSITETEEALKNTTVKAANSLKNMVSSSVETSEETGFESTVTDTIVNPNKCNTLTYHFFEIIETFRLKTRVEELAPFVLIPLGYPNVTKEWLLCHECLLRKHLPCSDLYAGFDAARLILANQRLGHFTAEGDEGDSQTDALLTMIEQILSSYHALQNATLLPTPGDNEDLGTVVQESIDWWIDKGGDLVVDGGKFIGDAVDAASNVVEITEDVVELVEDGVEAAGDVAKAAWESLFPPQASTAMFAMTAMPPGSFIYHEAPRLTAPGPGSFIYHEVTKLATPEILAALASLEAAYESIKNMPSGPARSQAIYTALQAFFSTIGDVDEAFRKVDIGLFIAVVSAVGVTAISGSLLATLSAALLLGTAGGAAALLPIVIGLGVGAGLSTSALAGLFAGFAIDQMSDADLMPDDRGLKASIHGLYGLYQQLGQALNLPVLGTDPTPEEVAAYERIRREREQQRRELAEAQVELERLICHIEEHIAHYFQIVAASIPTADVARLIEERFNIPGHVVELKFSHFVGDRAGLRVLDNAWLRLSGFDFEKELETIQASGITDTVENDTEVVLPTRGMLVEPMLGECCACDDFVKAHREKDLMMKDQEIIQTQLETERLRKRLEAGLLGDPTPFESTNSVLLDIDEEAHRDD